MHSEATVELIRLGLEQLKKEKENTESAKKSPLAGRLNERYAHCENAWCAMDIGTFIMPAQCVARP